MGEELPFRNDLYIGAAEDYQRYRNAYPPALLAELADVAGVSGQGRLLDLACGTGQVSLGLAGRFKQVLAVDLEPDMVRVGRSAAEQSGLSNIEWRQGAVEDLDLPSGDFELVTVGNAFHRLRRQVVAGNVFGWLRPGGCFALLWGGIPWQGDLEWQKAVSTIIDRWMDVVGSHNRVPSGWIQARTLKSDMEVLEEVGFEMLERSNLEVTVTWTVDTLTGFLYSTSYLTRALLGVRIAEFDEDLPRSLIDASGPGPYIQHTEFAYELARRPT